MDRIFERSGDPKRYCDFLERRKPLSFVVDDVGSTLVFYFLSCLLFDEIFIRGQAGITHLTIFIM